MRVAPENLRQAIRLVIEALAYPVTARTVDLESNAILPTIVDSKIISRKPKVIRHKIREVEVEFVNPSLESQLRQLAKGDELEFPEFEFEDDYGNWVKVPAGGADVADIEFGRDSAIISLNIEVEIEGQFIKLGENI